MTTQKRAKPGGEVAVNGEFYAGGKFIATTERPKTHGSRPSKPRKVEVEPYVWITLEAGDNRYPIMRTIGTGAKWIDRYDWTKGIEPYMPAFESGVMYNGETIEETQRLCDLWNAGERFVDRR